MTPLRNTILAIRRRSALILFLFSLVVLSFSYGYLTNKYQLFPYANIRNAVVTFTQLWAWAELLWPPKVVEHPHVIALSSYRGERLSRYEPARASNGVTLAQLYSLGGFGLVLLDMDGRVLHRWRLPDSTYEALAKMPLPIKPDYHEIMGAHLFANGDVLLAITYAFLVKLDRCSNMLWMQSGSIHHDVAVDDDGSIWTLGRSQIAEEQEAHPGFTAPYNDDSVIHLSPEGEVIGEFSVLDALFAGGYEALALQGIGTDPENVSWDPLHSNDVEIVDAAFARHNDFAAPGDLLVSLRHLNAIVLIDRDSKAVKWALSGPFMRQHDPDLQADGSISIVDNRTDRTQLNEAVHLTERQRFGYSRVLRLDPKTQEILWVFEGSPQAPFYTSAQGDHQILPNGNVLVVESEGGRIFEIDPADNSIVWEWFNALDLDYPEPLVGRITRATRYPRDYPNFLALDCP